VKLWRREYAPLYEATMNDGSRVRFRANAFEIRVAGSLFSYSAAATPSSRALAYLRPDAVLAVVRVR
jgi:hypothetical protein